MRKVKQFDSFIVQHWLNTSIFQQKQLSTNINKQVDYFDLQLFSMRHYNLSTFIV